MKRQTAEQEVPAPSEKEALEEEKIQLAKEIGIWGTFNPVEGYEASHQSRRIEEIDKRLTEIVNR
ncbi:hypothetical protein [Paenibacillus cymbidii]|uniref:hypothetical protein n=1 Tax=Paenibacillus cymbidii TaxID=1639034 RepID=UPI001080B9A5|nr:hypothetical protein [Paenibacillus cymbidii]